MHQLRGGERVCSRNKLCFVNVRNLHKIFAYPHSVLQLPSRLNFSLEMLPALTSPGHTRLGSERSPFLASDDIWTFPKGWHPRVQLSWDQCWGQRPSSLPSFSCCSNQGRLFSKKNPTLLELTPAETRKGRCKLSTDVSGRSKPI